MKKTISIVIIFIVIVFVLNYKNIIYTDYQQDYIYIYNKIINTYSFSSPQEETYFIENKDTYLKKIKNCKNEEDFIKEINLFLNNLNSIHTRLNNRYDSYAIYNIYKKVSNEMPQYKNQFEYIINEFTKQDVLYKYSEVRKNINEINSFYSSKANDDNFTYFSIVKDKIGYISIEDLFHPNTHADIYKAKKCLNLFRYYKILIIDLRNNSGGDSTYFTDMFLPMIVKSNLKMKYYSLIRDNTPATKNIKSIKKINNNMQIKNLIKYRFKNDSNYIIDKYKYYYECNTDVIKNKDSIEFDGKLYFLINEYTASSAAYFAAFVKDMKIGILMGSNTKVESVGNDAAMYILPKSKLMLRINDELIISDTLNFEKDGLETNGSVSPNIFVYSNLKKKLNYNTSKYDSCINLISKIENKNI